MRSGSRALAARGRRRRPVAAFAAAAACVPMLAACGGGGSGGLIELNLYTHPEPSGALAQAVTECSEASGGRYTITYNVLPSDADGQRQQLVRRLAAHDDSMDILGLDVTWTPEFAEAGWIREWTGENRREAEDGTLEAPLRTAMWEDKLYAVPDNTNTQLLWYRTDLVPNPPTTWDQMFSMAQRLADDDKPHRIEVQGAQYEGLVVWFTSLVESAGGHILTDDGKSVSLGDPAVTAAQIISTLANSAAADPSLPNSHEDDARLAMEQDTAAFELNYPFVYPSMLANRPDLAPNFAWAPWPRVSENEPAHVTVGGIDDAVSAFSKHPDEAFEAALCLRNRDHQIQAAIKGGLPPTLADIYDDPDFQEAYPFYQEIRDALESGSIRPQTPAYQNVSVVISHALSPPKSIDPDDVVVGLADQIDDALNSRGLIP